MEDRKELNLDEMEGAGGGSNPSAEFTRYHRDLIDKYGVKSIPQTLARATEEERQRYDELDQARQQYVKERPWAK